MSEVSGNAIPVGDAPVPEVPRRPQDHLSGPTGQTREVGLARISYAESQRGTHGECSCGWGAVHLRAKVLEDKIDRHLETKHGGRGIRL
jgi:hypothetical protein